MSGTAYWMRRPVAILLDAMTMSATDKETGSQTPTEGGCVKFVGMLNMPTDALILLDETTGKNQPYADKCAVGVAVASYSAVQRHACSSNIL
jgi:hypothetical protein